jgi:hypothetical protein
MSHSELATDSPTNYTTATWTNGANQGSGFTPWEFTNTAPKPIPPAELFNVDAENWAPATSWNVMSTTNGTSSAFRGFKSLEVGDQIYTRFRIDSVADTTSRVGFRLYQGTNLIYFSQYEDENNSWNINNSMSWTRTNPLAITEFIWGRSGLNEIDVLFKYEGSTILGVTGLYWTNSFPDKIEIFSEYQGINTGGIGLAELSAPAIPEPNTITLLAICVPILSVLWRKLIVYKATAID